MKEEWNSSWDFWLKSKILELAMAFGITKQEAKRRLLKKLKHLG